MQLNFKVHVKYLKKKPYLYIKFCYHLTAHVEYFIK